MNRQRKLSAAIAAAALALAGCSSGGHTSAPTSVVSSATTPAVTGHAATSQTISVGLIYDGTGLAASGNKTAPQGVEAGIAQAKKLGYNIKLYTADTQTSPSAALAAAQKLVEQDNVDVILSQSSLLFAAAPWLNVRHIPVIGVAEDGPEWTTDENMFSVYGATHTNLVTTWYGEYAKMQGGTNLGAIGYSISPSSAEAAEGAAKSMEAVGLKAGYVDATFPFGGTNVAPASLAMKDAGIDAFTATVDPNTGFAFVQELRNLGVDLKVVILPTGYGGDLTQAGAGAEQIAKGITFTLSFEPIEMHTAATQQIMSDLSAVGVSGEPTYAEYSGYADVALLVQALQSAGSAPTRASIVNALSGITSFDAWGLLGSHPLDTSDRSSSGMDLCAYAAIWDGSAFHLVAGAEPLCSSLVPGVTVAAP